MVRNERVFLAVLCFYLLGARRVVFFNGAALI